MPIYYPSCVVNILLRYDEGFQVDAPAPPVLPQSGSIDQIIEDTANKVVTGGEPDRGPGTPLITQTGNDNLSHFFNIVPRSATIELPGYRTAGTFSCQIQWNQLPIDPRLCRSALVQIFQGTVDPNDFATGMIRTNEDGTRDSIIKTTDEWGDVDEKKLILVGMVDRWKVTHEAKGSWVHFDGRDLRGIFLDSPVNPIILSTLQYEKSVDKVVEELLNTHPISKTKFFNFEVNARDWPNQKIPSPADNEIRPRRSASGKKTQMGVQTGSANYWDIITNLCFRVGAIPYFENQTLRIRPARTIFDRQDPASDLLSPFSNRTRGEGPRYDAEGKDFFIRKMIHGRNIEKLDFERKFTGVKVPVIECVATDHSSNERGKKKLLKVQYPSREKLAALVGSVSPDGLVAQTETVKIPVMGVRSKAQLEEIACSIYEEIGRGELGGACQTKDMASFVGSPVSASGVFPVDEENSDPDLLTIRPGDAVEFSVDIRQISSRAPIVNEFSKFNRDEFNEAVAGIKEAFKGKGSLIDDNTARVLVASYRSNIIDLLKYFRVYNVRYNWSNGVPVISFDFHNYFIARYSITDITKKAVERAAKQLGTKRVRKKKKPSTSSKQITPVKRGIASGGAGGSRGVGGFLRGRNRRGGN